jgi:hypothetical protein
MIDWDLKMKREVHPEMNNEIALCACKANNSEDQDS